MSNAPNVLFILSDQHNAKVLGRQGVPGRRVVGSGGIEKGAR